MAEEASFHEEATVANSSEGESMSDGDDERQTVPQCPTATPSYPRDFEFHHLAVKIPYIGQERTCGLFYHNNLAQVQLEQDLQTDSLWLIKKLGKRVWQVRGAQAGGEHRRSETMVNKRERITYNNAGESDAPTQAPLLTRELCPSYLRFSTHPDAPAYFEGGYLGRQHAFFPKIKMFSYYREGRNEKWKKRLALSLLSEYFNGDTLYALMPKLARRFENLSSEEQYPIVSGEPTENMRLGEPLIWHIINEVGKAIVTLHEGAPRHPDEDEIAPRGHCEKWKPIVHGSICPENIYFHFDHDFLDNGNRDENTIEAAHAQCFPRVVLGGFEKADFQDDEENSRSAWLQWLRGGDRGEDVIHQTWWDRFKFGELTWQMLFFGDMGLWEDFRSLEFPAVLLPNIWQPRPSVERYFAPENTKKHYGLRSFRGWDQDLVKTAFHFEYCLWTRNTQGSLEIGRDKNTSVVVRDSNRLKRIPTLDYIKTHVLPKAEEKLAEFRALTLKELRLRTTALDTEIFPSPSGDCDIHQFIAPFREQDTMIYKPDPAQVDCQRVNSLDVLTNFMENFPGPWSYVLVRYDPDRIAFDTEVFDEPETHHGVMPFGRIPRMGSRAPRGTDRDEKEEEERASGKTVQEIGQARRKRRAEMLLQGLRGGSRAPPTSREEQAEERRDIEEEEEAFQRHRARMAWLNRDDVLLDALNEVIE